MKSDQDGISQELQNWYGFVHWTFEAFADARPLDLWHASARARAYMRQEIERLARNLNLSCPIPVTLFGAPILPGSA